MCFVVALQENIGQTEIPLFIVLGWVANIILIFMKITKCNIIFIKGEVLSRDKACDS
jgi:hypothetical protein